METSEGQSHESHFAEKACGCNLCGDVHVQRRHCVCTQTQLEGYVGKTKGLEAATWGCRHRKILKVRVLRVSPESLIRLRFTCESTRKQSTNWRSRNSLCLACSKRPPFPLRATRDSLSPLGLIRQRHYTRAISYAEIIQNMNGKPHTAGCSKEEGYDGTSAFPPWKIPMPRSMINDAAAS